MFIVLLKKVTVINSVCACAGVGDVKHKFEQYVESYKKG